MSLTMYIILAVIVLTGLSLSIINLIRISNADNNDVEDEIEKIIEDLSEELSPDLDKEEELEILWNAILKIEKIVTK